MFLLRLHSHQENHVSYIKIIVVIEEITLFKSIYIFEVRLAVSGDYYNLFDIYFLKSSGKVKKYF